LLLRTIVALFLFACIWSCENTNDYAESYDEEGNLSSGIFSSSQTFDEGRFSSAAGESVDNAIIKATARMISIYHPEETFFLGTKDASAKSSEKPLMEVKLDYGFFMDIHEFTCGDYKDLDKDSLVHLRINCTNDSIPLTEVTYYDAVLIANAKSKKFNLDTVYTYTSAKFDSEKHCIDMEGLVTHLDLEGFRLPTEAEWILVAKQGWNPEQSWNNSNSDYKLHNVCSFGFDKAGFCDLAGNATEWTNDWLGTLADTTITNFTGATDGGALGERVIKGGNYSSSPTAITLYSRGDVYSVGASTTAKYVGFRLALGVVTKPAWLSNNGHISESKIEIIANSQTLKTYTESYNVKLAFRNDLSGNLAFIDYNNGNPKVTEIFDTLSVYHPEISPNGKWVAFCTKPEGVGGQSRLFVRELNESGSLAEVLQVESAAIPRWRILENGDTAIVYVTDAGSNADESSWKSQGTWQVSFSNGKFGTPMKIFDGSFHGGVSKDNSLAVTGATLLRAHVNENDQVWYSKEQACNVSLAQDGTKRIAFLDFSGKPGRDFVGSRYGVHKRILIADSTGKLIQTIAAPNGYTFDHSEWTINNSNINIVATLANNNGLHNKIVLIHPANNSVIDLVEGEELWHPNLWVLSKNNIIPSSSNSAESSSSISSSSRAINESSSSNDPYNVEFTLDTDSAGVYYLPGQAQVYAEARHKMELLWQYKDTANVVIIGSSRAHHGVAPKELSEEFFGINVAFIGTTLSGSEYMFNNYIIPHMSKVKYIVSSIDIDRGFNTFGGSFFNGYIQSCPGYVYDKNHNYWKDGYPKGLAELVYNAPGNSTYADMYRPTRGLHAIPSAVEWSRIPRVDSDSTWRSKYSGSYSTNFNSLTNMVKTSHEKGIYFIGVVFPQNPNYRNTGSLGRYGILRSEAPTLFAEISKLSETYPNFILFDENKMGDHDYTGEMSNDDDHLSYLGASHFTVRLDSLLKALPPLNQE